MKKVRCKCQKKVYGVTCYHKRIIGDVIHCTMRCPAKVILRSLK